MKGVDGKRPEGIGSGAKKNGAGKPAPVAPRRRVPFRAAGTCIFAASVRKLVGENVHPTDFRLLDEQL
jgi:hypothetical protein